MASIRRNAVLLRPAEASGLPPAERAHVAAPDRRSIGHRALAHAVCVLRILPLLPLAACVVGAWLAASVLTLLWAVLGAPFRRKDDLTLD
jgi:hypothetical protein